MASIRLALELGFVVLYFHTEVYRVAATTFKPPPCGNCTAGADSYGRHTHVAVAVFEKFFKFFGISAIEAVKRVLTRMKLYLASGGNWIWGTITRGRP